MVVSPNFVEFSGFVWGELNPICYFQLFYYHLFKFDLYHFFACRPTMYGESILVVKIEVEFSTEMPLLRTPGLKSGV